MKKSLVVVESPAKAKTIRKYLGPSYEVMASVGHILDLPARSMGVDLESGHFTPAYEAIMGKDKVIAEIKKNAKKVDTVYLAPDPDREGEAIAFHIASVVKEAKPKDPPHIVRVRFHELTKKAINEAFKHPDHLNQNLFDAQQARRILDRIVGYKISPILWKKVQRGLSAGRVQSVAVRLVVDREREIEVFVKEEYWTISALADAQLDPKFQVKLAKINNKKAEVHNEEQALHIKKALLNQSANVSKVQKKERIRRPGPPFITSKLQQDAARAFRFSTKNTMRIAQSLYEGIELGEEGAVGLITYMRTDSTRVSDDAIKEVRSFIEQSFGADFVPKSPNYFKNKKSAQEAHEAIRPTSVERTPDKVKAFLKPEQLKLYTLIFDRFVASQMTPAVYDQTTVEVSKDEYLLRATGSILRFAGFLKAYREQADEDDQNAKDEADSERIRLPDIKEGDRVHLSKVEAEQHFTQPPPRFSEASLVKELEEKGIGRPSTYAAIMSTIVDKGYAEKNQGRFNPTELGRIVTDLLLENFPNIMNVEFTASMEEKLDSIEDGAHNWLKILNDFYDPFKGSVDKAAENMRNIKRMEEKTDLNCEKCSSPLVIKWGKNGSFIGCSAYPECSFTAPFKRVDGKIVIEEKKQVSDVKCSSCGAPMVQKRGKFGEFLGCSRYPDCSNTMPLPSGIKCPKGNCGGDIVVKRSKGGKTFYGCSTYPNCDFVSWQKPVAKACETCDSGYLLEKVSRDTVKWVCPSCKAVTSPDE
ncbi:MAG: type I DNA topoisomerase [Myxococcales bacterium]|nr:MAG: type I DNA topoisomerase [Myxococcales bacterium]